MRAVIQRVRLASVAVDGETVGRIEQGLLVYIGVATTDGAADADYLAEKVANLRIFPDKQGKMNLSVQDVRGGVLAVPNFTLLADARKGRRPAFVKAAPPEQAEPLQEAFVSGLRDRGCPISRGVFGAHMLIDSLADGPVNIVLDSPPPT